MKTIAYLPPADNRMIDLQRSLKLPYGSLTPHVEPEPRWRIEARQAAEEFQRATLIGAIAFFLLVITIIAYVSTTAS